MTCPVCKAQLEMTRKENSLIIDKILLGENCAKKLEDVEFNKLYTTVKEHLLDVSQEFNTLIEYFNDREYENQKILTEFTSNYADTLKTFVLSIGKDRRIKKKLYENSMETSRNFDEYIKDWYFKNCIDVLLIEMPILNSEMSDVSINEFIKDPKFSGIFKKMGVLSDILMDSVLSRFGGNNRSKVFINEVSVEKLEGLVLKSVTKLAKSNILTEGGGDMASYETPAETQGWNRRALLGAGVAVGGITAAGLLMARAMKGVKIGNYNDAKKACSKIKDDKLRKSCYEKISRKVLRSVDPLHIDDTDEDPGTLYKTVKTPPQQA